MSLQLGPRRGPRLLRRHQSATASNSLQNLGSVWPDLGGVDLGQELLALAGVVAVVLIPVVFFGLELIILGALLAAGVIARSCSVGPG